MIDFDTPYDRSGTHSVKHDLLPKRFGASDLAPLWVADMEFAAPNCVVEAIKARASHEIYGYTTVYDRFLHSIAQWQQKRHGWMVDDKSIVACPGVVPSIIFCIETFSKAGDGVIVQPPVYPPFLSAVEESGRRLLKNELRLCDGRYEIDFDDLEQKAKEAKILLLCSPHNPVGRVWSGRELQKLGEIALRYDLIVISDEIHADLVFSPHKHTPFASMDRELSKRTITLNAASKSFNIAGLNSSYAIIEDDSLRRRLVSHLARLHLSTPNLFGMTATTAAYEDGEEWLSMLLAYLQKNRDYALEFTAKQLSGIDAFVPEGTFLLWMDFRSLGMDDDALKLFLTQKAKVALNAGITFGNGGSGFSRLNFALCEKKLQESLLQIQRALESL